MSSDHLCHQNKPVQFDKKKETRKGKINIKGFKQF